MNTNACIEAIATYLPEAVLTNDMLQAAFPELKIKELTRLTGVGQRHIAAPGETAGDMAFRAAEKLFGQYPVYREQVDFIIFCSAGRDYLTPATACVLQHRLHLSESVGAFDFNQGCTGYLYGLSMAKGLVATGVARKVLLLTSEAITNTIHPLDKSNRAIFGDGATASLIAATDRPDAGIGDFVFGTDGSHHEDIIVRHGGERFPLPESAEADFLDAFGNVRNHARFYMNGSAVFQFSVGKAPLLVQQLLEKNKLHMNDVDLFVFHQANLVILETIGKKLKLAPAKNHIYLAQTGNTVASTIPFAIEDALLKKKIGQGSSLLLGGFGVGFSWGGTIVRL